MNAGKGAQPTKYHRSLFLKDVKAAFPELRSELNTWYGLLHLEMHAFTDFTQKQIDGRERTQLTKCFEIADKCLRQGNAALQNALFVSFLEHLNFTDGQMQRHWAWDMMPSSLRQGYQWIMAENAKAAERYKTKPPQK